MARRRKRRRGSKKKSVALLPILPPVLVIASGVEQYGFTRDAGVDILAKMTGYGANSQTFDADRAKGFWLGEIVAIVAHKVANQTGVNAQIRKLTGGWLSL